MGPITGISRRKRMAKPKKLLQTHTCRAAEHPSKKQVKRETKTDVPKQINNAEDLHGHANDGPTDQHQKDAEEEADGGSDLPAPPHKPHNG